MMKIRIKRLKPSLIAATLCGLLFMFLLGIRLGFFQKETHYIPSPLDSAKISEKAVKISENERWMNIFHQDRKIGYAYRSFKPENNGYCLSESVYMRINTLGTIEDIYIQTKGKLHSDLTLASFAFDLRSNLFHFKCRGEVEGKILTIFIGKQKSEIPIDKELYLADVVMDAAWISGLEPDKIETFLVFDPTTMGQRPVRVTMVGCETLNIMGRRQNTKRVSIDFMGTSHTAWIGEDGIVVQEEGFMGIKLKRVSKNEALSGLPVVPSQDLTEMTSVASNVPIDRVNEVTMLCLKITGIKENLFLDGGRQTFKNGVLTIRKEDIPEPSDICASDKESLIKSRSQEPTPFIQCDHPKIRKKVSELISIEDLPPAKAQKLIAWIYENIEKRPVLSVPNALETLENRMGDCNEHAVLLAAMARAAGIPAQIEAGLVYVKGRFYYHAWNVLYLGKWITADSLMGQIPADVTHIRLVRGEPDSQMDLIGVIGKVKLEILEQSR
jgi:hypothetical protein